VLPSANIKKPQQFSDTSQDWFLEFLRCKTLAVKIHHFETAVKWWKCSAMSVKGSMLTHNKKTCQSLAEKPRNENAFDSDLTRAWPSL